MMPMRPGPICLMPIRLMVIPLGTSRVGILQVGISRAAMSGQRMHRTSPGRRTKTMNKKSKTRIGLYPGTFDPVTNGHIDVIARAARLLDKLVVGVSINTGKGPMFTLEERVELVEAEIASIADKNGMLIEVMPFDTLLVEFARKVGASMIVRGLRAVSDFDYEIQMAGMNYRMAPDVETVFLMASERHQFIASRLVKEVAKMGGDISSFVPPLTLERVLKRLRG